MANIKVDHTTNLITVEFNDYSSVFKTSKAVWHKTDIRFELSDDTTFVRVYVRGETDWNVCKSGGNYSIIDEVDGVAPSSNSDLYDKLIALLG